MPDNYLDSSIVGFNHQDALDLQVDTYKRLSPILNMEDKPAIDERFAMNLSILQEGNSDKIPDVQRINMGAALISDDPNIKAYAQRALKAEVDKTPEFKYGLGRAIESPYNDYAKKFFNKEFGYSALRDNEDFYYNNTWGEMSTLGRMWRTPFKMAARIIPQAVLKIGAGLGYVGSMIGSIGSNNYWADVADNAFSNWFEHQEQIFKDRVIPVYKQAGFDEKGFFSKLFDSAYWNDEVADGIAFMLGAASTGMGVGALGRLGAVAGGLNTFGKAFSTVSTLGKTASKVGMGSWAELSSLILNTGMEAGLEGAGVFKEVTRRLKIEREEGLNDLSDEEIRQRAGHLAGNTVMGNAAILLLPNAWENTLFFKPFKNVKGRAGVGLREDLTGFSRTLDNLEKASPFASSLSRTNFYGKQLATGFVAEGLWEENAQLAIQRINQGDAEGRTGLFGFASQLSKQTIDAFTGKDKEASESIGLGALIGMGASVVFSKMANERKSILENTREAIQSVNAARQNLFDTTDVYERDTDNNIVYENNIPKLSQAKLIDKQKALETEYGKITLANDEKYYQSEPVKFETRRALANYVRSLNKVGVKDISARLANISPQQSTLFGMNPTAINKESAEFAGIARQFEDISDDVEDTYIPPIPDNTTRKKFIIDTENRKAEIYSRRTDNVILSNFIVNHQSELLKSLNEYRKLQNASIAQFPVDQLNGLIIQERTNKQVIDSDSYKQMSDLEKEYHIQRDKELKELIASYKNDNKLTLEDSIKTENGFYKATTTDSNGNKKPVEFDTRSVNLQRGIANYSNVIDKNSYIDRLISDKDNGHANYMKLQNNQLDKLITEAILASEKKKTKYKEINKGDFEKVTKLVAKMVFGENQQYSPEELQLQQNYADLISDILPQYEVAIEQQRIKNFENRLSTLRNTQAAISTLVVKRGTEIDDQKLDLLILQEELENLVTGKRADRKKVTDAINSLSAKIEEAEKGLVSEREKLSLITEQIELLESEIAGGNFRKLYTALQDLKKERDWSINELARTSALLDKVKKIVKDIIKVASRLIPNFSYKNLDRILGDDVYGSKNKEAYDPSVVQAYEEIKGRVNETADLEKTIEGLKQVIPELNAKYEDDKRQVNDILAQVDKYFADQYLDTTKKAPAKIDAETETITKNLTADKGLFPQGNNSGGDGFNPKDGFDGNTYQRPLHTKFFTSTFPFISATEPDADYKSFKDAPKNVQDYFDFVEFLTNENNTKKIKEKLGDGEVKVLVVTRNNYKELGLEGVLSDRKDKNGKSFFENEDPKDAIIELIPVIEDGGDFYYTDKDLNKLGKIGETISPKTEDIERRRQEELAENAYRIEDSAELYVDDEGRHFIISYQKDGSKRIITSDENGKRYGTIQSYEGSVPVDKIIHNPTKIEKEVGLRSDKLTDKINAKYDAELAALKPKGKKVSSDIVRTVLRLPRFTAEEQAQYSVKHSQEDMNAAVKVAVDWRKDLLKQTTDKQVVVMDFDISRGIPNQQKVEGDGIARNPVTDVLLPEKKINGQSVMVFSTPEQVINGETITVPIGRPFIKTTNGIHEQLHAADNTTLSTEQLTVVNRIFSEMIKDHLDKVMKIVNAEKSPVNATLKKRIEEVGIANLNNGEKKALYLQLTKNKPSLFNTNYTNFLSSIIYFNKLEKDDNGKYKTPGKNQVYMDGFMFVLGTSGNAIDMTNPADVLSPEVQEFFEGQYHNIKYFTTSTTANKQYLEYYLDDNELKVRTWKTYAHYLLSSQYPDKTDRPKNKIPVTTSIKTKEQHDLEKGEDPYYPYLSRGIIVQNDAIPAEKKKVVTEPKKEKAPTQKEVGKPIGKVDPVSAMYTKKRGKEEVIVTDSEDTSMDAAAAMLSKKKAQPEKTVEKLEDKKADIERRRQEELKNNELARNSLISNKDADKEIIRINTKYDAELAALEVTIKPKGDAAAQMLAKKKAPKPDEDIPDFDTDEGNALPMDSAFRIARGGAFKMEEDLDALVVDIKRMIPQFPVERLRNTIKVTDGIEAWGQFTNNMIYLYEKAEKGTGYHEVFEAVVNKLLTDPEWRAIYKEFTSRKGSFQDRETGEYLTYAAATPHQAKEQMAEEFMDYKLTGKLPTQHQTRSFFKIIWDFIKTYILNRPTISGIFAKIDQGKFAKTSARETDRFAESYRKLLPELKAKVKKDLADGASAFIFNNLFLTPKSLTQLDEIKLNDKQIYEPVKVKFQETITGLEKLIQTEIAKKSGANQKRIQDYKNSISYITHSLNNWGDFVAFHKETLKPFRIRFEQSLGKVEDGLDKIEDELDKTEDERERENRNDYLKDEFKTSGKKSASKSIRFLFGTLIEKRFDGQGETVKVGNTITGKTVNTPSSVFMPSLVDYDKYMLNALEEFTGISDFSTMEEKLKALAGITEIENTKNPEKRAELIAGLPSEKAVWTSLYLRLFGTSQHVDEESAINLKVKFHSYASKHSPTPFVYIYGAGNSSIIESVKRGSFESLVRTIESSIISQRDLIFSTTRKGGRITFKANKEFSKEIAAKDKIEIDENGVKKKIKGFEGEKAIKFIEFLGLNNEQDTGMLNSTFINSLSREDYNLLMSKLRNIRNALTKVNTPTLDIKGMNIFGFLTKPSKNVADEGLIPFLDRKLGLSELGTQFFNIENQPQQRHITPSYISRIIGDINNLSKSDLLEKYPQLDNFFAKSSIMMERLYDEDGNRTSYEISLGYMEGIKDIDENEGTKSSRLELSDKYWLQFNATLAGLHYSLPADSETEWVFNMGEFVTYSENMLDERGQSIVDEIFIPYLKTEIETAIASGDNLLQFNSIHPSTGKTIGKSLRFFKNILASDKELLKEIHEDIENNVPADKIIGNVKTNKKRLNRIRIATLAFLNGEVENTIDTLREYRLVQQDEEGYTLNSLDNKFVEANKLKSDQGYTVLNEGQFKGVVQYQKVNSIIGLMEQFKLFYGDPAQYKDWEKRAKSLFSPIEQTFTDKNNTLNNWLNINKNSAVLGDEKVELPLDDWFRRDYSNKLKSRTVADLKVVAVETTNDLQDIIDNGSEEEATFVSKFISAYSSKLNKETGEEEAQIDEADGQSVGTIGFARELLTKSAWRWTDEMENYYQYDTALMRQELSKLSPNNRNHYNYGDNQALRDIDGKIVEYYKNNPPTNPITPVKTSMPSSDENSNQLLLKHSVHFASYQVSKDFELLDTYVDMLKRGDDLLNFKSAQKIGHLVDNEGSITNYYSDPFTKNNLASKGNPQFEIDYRTIGIQVETQTSGKKQTIGTQMTKLINLNLFEKGVPRDFGGLNNKDAWDLLSEEEKLSQSANYRLVKGDSGTIKTLEALKRKSAIDTLSKLGINWTVSPSGELLFNVDNLTKLKQFIHDEMRRLEVDENTVDNIELAEDLKSFLNPAETLPSYNTISNLLWSMADKATASMKVNGKPYIQVSSAFFNKGSRKAAYKDEKGKWIEVNTKAEYDRLVAEGKIMVMTSSELKFYRRGEDGKTLPMEIYLPHIYKQKVNDKRKSKNLPPLTDQQLMDHLNANPRLLEGIGFRIPTQATSSLEFFKIKGFLPENFGSAVVVPSAITTKGGSDFDVDKLNTYLNNWKLGKDGLPFYEEYKDNSNSTEQDRYISFVKGTERNFNAILEDMKTSSEFLNVADKIIEGQEELRTQEELIGAAKSLQKEIRDRGLDIFHELPLSVRQQFYEKEEELDSNDITGAEKTLEYLSYVDNWIKAFSEGKGLELPYKREIAGKIVNASDTIYPEDVLPTFNELITNYKEFLNEIGVKDEIIEEYRQLKKEKKEERESIINNFRFKLAKVIAEFNGVISYDQFNKLPMYLQNTKGALENRYFTSLRNVLESPDMFKYLLSPNSIGHIRENRDEVQKAIDENWQPEDKKELDYTRFLSTEYISEKRNAFTKGKSDIGIFAIALTNFANSQITGIGISELGSIKEMDSYVFDELNDSRIDLPFEDIPMQYIRDSWFIPLSVVKDRDGRYTMDKISAYINGAVDVAKEPLIIEMGMHTELASVYMLMERMGLTGKTTALFLYQPSIREYLKELLFLERKTYFGTSEYKGTTEMQKAIVDNYSGKDISYDPDYKFTDAQLVELIRKGEKVKKGEATWTEEELKAQRLALVNFLKMKMFGNHLLENIQASNHDTASIRSSYSLLRKDLLLERSQKGNMIMKIDGENLINGGESLIDETFVKTDITMMKMFNSLFSNIGLFALQKTNPKKTLTNIARRIFNSNPFISNDDFIRTMRDYESSIIDILTNDVHIETEVEGKLYSNKLYQFADQFFNPERAGNIRNRFNAVKKKQEDGDFIYDKFIKNNFFLSNLNIYFDKESGLDLMELKVKRDNDAVLTKEKLTEGLRSVLTIDESKFPEMAALGRAIVNAAFIQFGIRYGRDSFVELIPSEDMKQLTGAALENIDNEDFRTLDEQVQRSRWHRKNIVPQMLHRTLHFISPNPNNPSELILEANQRTYNMKNWKNPPTKQSQTFFGVYDGKEIVPSIHPAFIWGGYKESPKRWEDMPNIISIPAVRPEYLIEKDGKPVPDTVEIDKMKKKGDYSYLFDQEYKKVGVEDNSLARQIISGDKKKSINYLYKPINKYTTRKFNGQIPLLTTPENTVIGEPSILNFPPFVELEDNELIAKFNNVGNRVEPVFRPKFEEVSNTLKPKNKAAVSTRDTIQMKPDNIAKIEAGIKTTTVRSITEGSKIRIKSGNTERRFIGEKEYAVTNRGYLTIEEAGGKEAILKSEGYTNPSQFHFKNVLDWYNGMGKMYVYDIRPIQEPPTDDGTIINDIKRIPNCK